ncbi:MAG: hypothetical protein RBR14_06485 [Candidatus Cloacimonas acidaminovorans]|nr:hypothetical protein [Candidatus Cloacimonas acidaminovorans]
MRIKDLALSLDATSVQGGDVMVIDDITGSDITKKITILNIANWINHGCYNNNYGNLATLDTAQTLTNKRLTAPKINSNNAVNATSEQINILFGATITTSELNMLHGIYGAIVDTESNQTLEWKRLNYPRINSVNEVTVTSEEINYLSGVNENLHNHLANIENQIENIMGSIANTYHYRNGFRATYTGTYVLFYEEICANLGLPGDTDIDPNVIVNVWEGDDQYNYVAVAGVRLTNRLGGTRFYLNEISFEISSGHYYMVNLQFKKVN